LQEYVNHRLEVAGREANDLFEDDTFEIIHRYSGGVPRLINTLCDTALLCAFADDKRSVSGDDIMAAIAELNWKEHDSNTGLHEKLRRVSDRLHASSDVTRIEVRSDGDVLSHHSFPIGRIIVGRSPDNEIYIKSKFVSRHHAQLISDENGCVVEDLNSTNGVFIGAKQVKKHRLRNGDVMSLGVHELVYTDLRETQSANEEMIVADVEESLADNVVQDDKASVVRK
jgi:hypothetical protein